MSTEQSGSRITTANGDYVDIARSDEWVSLRLENVEGPTWVLLTPAEATQVGDALKRAAEA